VLGVPALAARLTTHSKPGAALAKRRRCYFPEDAAALQAELRALRELDSATAGESRRGIFAVLANVPDIGRQLTALRAHAVLEDVDFFALKRLLFAAADLSKRPEAVVYWGAERCSELDAWARETMAWLHPEATPSARFHLSAKHDEALGEARKERTAARRNRDETALAAAERRTAELEAGVRERLSARLVKLADALESAADDLARLDYALARVELREELGGSWPSVDPDDRWSFSGGRLPRLGSSVEPIAAELSGGRATIVTGPNMGGKTALLQLLGLCTWCAQHAWPCPAESVTLPLVSGIVYVGAEASRPDESGLSSFAREVRRVVTQRDELSGPGLWLLDEVGRGTHPEEGGALARNTVRQLEELGHTVVAATHFPELANLQPARHLTIRGLDHESLERALRPLADEDAIVAAISAAMRHQPIPVDAGTVPRDATVIAKALGLHSE
jgi:hypothetical protein